MFRWLLTATGLALCAATSLVAQTCPNYPYALSNGSTADASQVMANFNSIETCANNSLAPLANPHVTGSLGVDTTTPGDNLDVYGQAVMGNGVERLSLNSGSLGFNRRVATGAIYNPAAYAFQFLHNGTGVAGTDYLGIQVYTGAGASVTGEALTVNGAGDVTVDGLQSTYPFFVNGAAGGTTAWTNTSDARLKTNVETIPNALALVERLRGVRFQWRPVQQRTVGKTLALPVGEPQIGFIAQEVASVVPEVVVAPKNAEDVYTVKESSLLPILVEALKEQQKEIAELRAEVAALQSRE